MTFADAAGVYVGTVPHRKGDKALVLVTLFAPPKVVAFADLTKVAEEDGSERHFKLVDTAVQLGLI